MRPWLLNKALYLSHLRRVVGALPSILRLLLLLLLLVVVVVLLLQARVVRLLVERRVEALRWVHMRGRVVDGLDLLLRLGLMLLLLIADRRKRGILVLRVVLLLLLLRVVLLLPLLRLRLRLRLLIVTRLMMLRKLRLRLHLRITVGIEAVMQGLLLPLLAILAIEKSRSGEGTSIGHVEASLTASSTNQSVGRSFHSFSFVQPAIEQ